MNHTAFGFHSGAGRNRREGITPFLGDLNTDGIPFTDKFADGMPYEAQVIAAQSSVSHFAIYRRSMWPNEPPASADVPNYWLSPETAAQQHWARHKSLFPPELIPGVTWVEIINEVAQHFDFEAGDTITIPVMWGRERIELPDGRIRITNGEWLAQFALEAASLALADGHKLAMFGFAPGEPEPEIWDGLHMQAFLAMCAQHPEHLAVSLHEYSLSTDHLWTTTENGRVVAVPDLAQSDLIGRFRHLADAWPGVTIFLSEWGWEHADAPAPDTAVAHIGEFAHVLTNYPNVKSVAIWYLGPNFGDVAAKVQQLIEPLRAFILSADFPSIPTDPPPAPDPTGRGAPRVQYARTVNVIPEDASEDEAVAIFRQGWLAGRQTTGGSYDDAGIGDLDDRTAVLWNISPERRGEFADWYWLHYPNVHVEFRMLDESPLPQVITLAYRPCDTEWITQVFGANPGRYAAYGLPGHEGIDYGVAAGRPFYAAADGRVAHASDRRWSSNDASNYGWHVVIDHGSYCTVYAHAQPGLPVRVGQQVRAGQVVGLSGNTGLSTGYHLHFGLLDKTGLLDPDNGYPEWVYGRPVDPWPYLDGLDAPPTQPPPPPAEPTLLGLHASADPGNLYGGAAEHDEFKALRPGVIKVLSAHSAESVRRLAYDNPTAEAWIVRAFLHWGGRDITPQQFCDWTLPDVQRTIAALDSANVPARAVLVELHNEPNLADEGLVITWANGAEFGRWLQDVARLYRQALGPDVRLLYPGLSPGGDVTIDGQLVRQSSMRFLEESAFALEALDGLAVHCYWSQHWPMQLAYEHLDWHNGFNMPLWVTEASRNDRPEILAPDQYAAEYVQFLHGLQARQMVRGVTYFVASASNSYFEPECWVVNGHSKGIAAEMRRLMR